MRLFTLHKEQLIKRPRDEVFSFFEKPENLKLLTPPHLNFAILTPLPIEIRSGALIDYSVRILGVRRHWTTLITVYKPPELFADVQLRGPYTFWHHTHKFIESTEGTLITDDVRYIIPLGLLGRLVRQVIIKRQLDKIFNYRANVISRYFSE